MVPGSGVWRVRDWGAGLRGETCALGWRRAPPAPVRVRVSPPAGAPLLTWTLLISRASYDQASLTLADRSPAVSAIRRVLCEPSAMRHETLESLSHADSSHAVPPARAAPEKPADTRPDPKTDVVTGSPPWPRVGTLTTLGGARAERASKENASVADAALSPTCECRSWGVGVRG